MIVISVFLLLSHLFIKTSQTSEKQLTIERSVSFNHHNNYVAANAHDGDYNTWYSVKDGAVAGNFLKLYLSRTYSIGKVKMVSRVRNVYAERMKNTAVRVYSTKNIETEVSSCGIVTETNPGDTNTIEGRTYYLNCKGAVGDMLYLTDLDYDAEVGHSIAEVEIFGSDILPIERSEAKSWYQDNNSERFAPEKAYDGDYTTKYSVKDGDAEGNFLKLFLSDKYRIGTVKLTNVQEGCCQHRILGTVVMVYSIGGKEETKVANCGEKITDYDDSLEFQTFSLNCNGAAGDMIYITDTDTGNVGHSISEVYVIESTQPLRDTCTALPDIEGLSAAKTVFPVEQGTVVTVSCDGEHTLIGDGIITCTEGVSFQFKDEPRCAKTCTSLPEIDRLVTNVNFPIVEGTVIEISCNHTWYDLLGDHMITCAKDQEFVFEETPSCTKEVGLSCLSLDTKKGEQAYLPVKMTGGDVTWDRLFWSVFDQSLDCLEKCNINEMFSFKVDVAGVYEYFAKMEKEGEVLECGNKLFVNFGPYYYVGPYKQDGQFIVTILGWQFLTPLFRLDVHI